MKKGLTVLVLSLTLIGSFQLKAQTAEEIVSTYLEALGGEENLSKVQTLTFTCSAKAQGMDIPITMYQKAPGLQRMDMNFQGKIITQMAFDGTEAWGTNFMTMEAEKWDAQRSAMLKAETDFMDSFLGWKEKGYSISLEGEEDIEGTPCYKIKLTKAPLTIDGESVENFSYCFFDKESSAMIMERSFQKEGEAKGMITETFMGDYEEVDGYIFAHTISQKMGGQVVFSLTIDKIEIDKELEEDFFSFPAASAEDKK